MRHKETVMLKKHYAIIIKDMTPSTYLIISKIIGLDYEEPTTKPKTV